MHIRSLTGLRGLAALWVLTDHFQPYFETLLPGSVILKPFFQRGYFGVDLFFLLSGFLLTMRYWDSFSGEKIFSQRFALLDYGAKRFARIYPTYLFTLLIAIALYSVAILVGHEFNNLSPNVIDPLSVVLNLLMVQNWFQMPSINGPSWSVSCEFAAYLVLPLVWVGLRRLKRVQLIFSLLVLEVACALIYITCVNLNLFVDPFEWIQIATEVTSGCCTYLLIREINLFVKHKRLLLSTFTGILAMSVLLVPKTNSDWLVRSYVPFLLLAIISLSHQAPYSKRGLSSKPLVSLGIYSYSLYLTHGLIWNILSGLNFPGSYSLPIRIIQMLSLFAVPIAIAALTTHLIENPGRNFVLSYNRMNGK